MWVDSDAVASVMKRDSEHVQTRATIARAAIIQLETNRNWSVIRVPGRNTHRSCVIKTKFARKASKRCQQTFWSGGIW